MLQGTGTPEVGPEAVRENVESIRVRFPGAGLSNEIWAPVPFNLLPLDISSQKGCSSELFLA